MSKGFKTKNKQQREKERKTKRGRQKGEQPPERSQGHQKLKQITRESNKNNNLFVSWLLNAPATCECISGTDLLRQCTCCHTEREAEDQTLYFTQSQYTDTGPTTDPISPGTWQGSHWSANFDSNPGSSALETEALTTRPARRSITSATAQNTNNGLC